MKKGITNGKANGLFGSNDPCTRAQIVTFLFRAYNK
ncbi:MAG: S-layer homology domain-containing protein [Oscillibacter sp.]|nr:S-layer homology domain-containing protein [uncultured Dysosmobacter sp.]MDD6408626.1 S-layer homology domain-containing protein [Oscillibacter sp.]